MLAGGELEGGRGNLIQRGAEAELSLDRWMGRDVVVKERVRKGYRHPELDRRIRRSRTALEVKLLREARQLGVPTPVVYDIDLARASITMEYITGPRLKDVLAGGDGARELCRQVGRQVAALHAGGIVHGDLTTSNMLVHRGSVYFIDLSLGGKREGAEDRGVDLHLLKEAMESTHARRPELFDMVIEGYLDGMEERGAESGGRKSGEETVKKIREIEKRGRYT